MCYLEAFWFPKRKVIDCSLKIILKLKPIFYRHWSIIFTLQFKIMFYSDFVLAFIYKIFERKIRE